MHRIAVVMPVKRDDAYFRQAVQSVFESEMDEYGDIGLVLIMVLDPSMPDEERGSIIKWNLQVESPSPFIHTSVILGRIPDDVPSSHSRVAYLLNNGILAAQALKFDFIARMDADDICLPDRFKEQLGFLLDNPDVGVVGTSWKAIGPDQEVIEVVRELTSHYRLVAERLAVGRPCFAHPTVMIRMAVFQDIKSSEFYPTEHAAEDYALWCAIATETRWKLDNMLGVFYLYRYHDGQLARTDTDRLQQSARTIFCEYFPEEAAG